MVLGVSSGGVFPSLAKEAAIAIPIRRMATKARIVPKQDANNVLKKCSIFGFFTNLQTLWANFFTFFDEGPKKSYFCQKLLIYVSNFYPFSSLCRRKWKRF